MKPFDALPVLFGLFVALHSTFSAIVPPPMKPAEKARFKQEIESGKIFGDDLAEFKNLVFPSTEGVLDFDNYVLAVADVKKVNSFKETPKAFVIKAGKNLNIKSELEMMKRVESL